MKKPHAPPKTPAEHGPSAPGGQPRSLAPAGVRIVNMLEAKTQLSRLVEAIELGQDTEVVIARNGSPLARLTGLKPQRRPRRLGVAKGLFAAPNSMDAANPLLAELFEQG